MEKNKIWQINKKSMLVVEEEKKVYRLKHGMLASIPLICKGEDCPYASVCRINEQDRVAKERYLMEISAILSRFESLCAHFEIDTEVEEIEISNVVDVSMIKDIVDIEIQILRCENLVAVSGDFIAEHIAQVDRDGHAYYEDIIHPGLEYKMKLIEQRNKIYTRLNATRKDKIEINKKTGDYSAKALDLIEKVHKQIENLDLDNIPFGDGGESNG